MSEANEFLLALCAEKLPYDEMLILCGFPGDPAQAGPSAWRPRGWVPGMKIPYGPKANAYATVATFRQAPDGSWRRRGETFAAGRALMVDDVGTKVDPALVAGVPPSCRVETSPGNEQWWYFLSEPERDAAKFDGVIRAFISGKLLGSDPGMSGVTRVGRIPGFWNGKPAYNGWQVAMRDLSDRRFTLDELLAGFSLKINGRRETATKLHSAVAQERNRAFMAAYKFLEQRGMLKRDEPDPSGWIEMKCFNLSEHTGGVDNGCAIREPAPENEYYGALKCNHGHCVNLGWKDLTEWISEQAAEELEDAASADTGMQPIIGI